MKDLHGKPVREGFYIHSQGTGETPLFVSRERDSWYVESFQDKDSGRIPLEQNYASFLTPAGRREVKMHIKKTREDGARLLREAAFYESRLPETAQQLQDDSRDTEAIEHQLAIRSR